MPAEVIQDTGEDLATLLGQVLEAKVRVSVRLSVCWKDQLASWDWELALCREFSLAFNKLYPITLASLALPMGISSSTY